MIALRYYTKLLGFSKRDSESFEELFSDGDAFKDCIEDRAARWISEARPRCSNEVECRRVVFRDVFQLALNAGLLHKEKRMVAMAFAMVLIDQIELRVRKFDASMNLNLNN